MTLAAEMMKRVSVSGTREHDPARELSFGAGYPHGAIRDLVSSDSAVVRSAAARTLGAVGNPLTTAYLVAALFDREPEVRGAAAEALIRLRDPDVAVGSVKFFLEADSERTAAEAGPAPLPGQQEENPRFATETWERNEAEGAVSECPPVAAYAQGWSEREQALVSIDGPIWDLPPPLAADLYSADPEKRASALLALARLGLQAGGRIITRCFDDPSLEVRNAAAVALGELEPGRSAELFSQAFESASPQRCRNIGEALVGSGLAEAAINDLGFEDRERAYNALCLLSVMAKYSVVQPLVQAIEKHESTRVRSAALRLLSLNGWPEVADAAVRRRLGIRPKERMNPL